MDNDTRKWVEEAIGVCSAASRSNVLILIRNDGGEDTEDVSTPMVITNAATPEQIHALGQALACDYTDPEGVSQ